MLLQIEYHHVIICYLFICSFIHLVPDAVTLATAANIMCTRLKGDNDLLRGHASLLLIEGCLQRIDTPADNLGSGGGLELARLEGAGDKVLPVLVGFSLAIVFYNIEKDGRF